MMLSTFNTAYALNSPVATLSKVVGKVDVILAKNQRMTLARNGLLLYAKDLVKTGNDGKATLLFRDGSEIRLFESTEFLIESAKEAPTKKRSFRYKLRMKKGAFWGMLKRGRQNTTLSTPTATIGVKGTALRVTELDNGSATIALTEGSIEVRNGASMVKLTPGKWLRNIQRMDDLKQRVTDIPNKLYVSAERDTIDFSKDSGNPLYITIQMGSADGVKNIKRGGPVYLKHNYYNLRMPAQVILNGDGFVRFPIYFEAPRKTDANFDGRIIIRAVMDGKAYTDVGEGSVILKVSDLKTTRKFRIDVETGVLVPVE